MSYKYTVNVIVPNAELAEIAGVKATKLGVQLYSDYYEKIKDGVYRLMGAPVFCDYNDIDCDVEWIKKNYVTVTPLVFDKTDYATLEKLDKEFDL